MRPLAAAILLGLAALPREGRAQGLQSSIDAANRRWTEYQEALDSSDVVARFEALQAAIADENIGIRNNALWSILRNRVGLPISVVLEPGGRLNPGEVPNVDISGVRWDPRERSFSGTIISHGFRSNVTGELIEGKVRVRYSRLQMPSQLGLSRDSPQPQRPMALRDCTVVLSISPADRALTGPLRCEGLSQTFGLRMPLG